VLNLRLVGQEYLVFLLKTGVSVETTPVLLHECTQSFLEIRIDDYFLEFGDYSIEFSIIGSLIGAYIKEVLL
jgi:hypothetical protein